MILSYVIGKAFTRSESNDAHLSVNSLIPRRQKAVTFDTPVLVLAWRRPHLLRQVIDAMRAVRPTSLFFACDGPRLFEPKDVEEIAETIKIIDQEIDWPCGIQRRYLDSNHGCKTGVSSAISWFFDHVSEGIILEDDCVPHPDFFVFCRAILDRYRDNRKVWCVTGDNFQSGQKRGAPSYYFSKYNHVWGWATWSDRWARYDREMSYWPQWRDSSQFAGLFSDSSELNYWTKIFDDTYSGKIDTWDYQWTACVWQNGGLTATPQTNLVTNIGFGIDATHTQIDACHRFCIPAGPLPGKLRHPLWIRKHAEADRYVGETVFGYGYPKKRRRNALLAEVMHALNPHGKWFGLREKYPWSN